MNDDYLKFKLKDNGNIEIELDGNPLAYYDKTLDRFIIEKTLSRVVLSRESLEDIAEAIITYHNQLDKIKNINNIISDMFREDEY